MKSIEEILNLALANTKRKCECFEATPWLCRSCGASEELASQISELVEVSRVVQELIDTAKSPSEEAEVGPLAQSLLRELPGVREDITTFVDILGRIERADFPYEPEPFQEWRTQLRRLQEQAIT